MHARARTGEIDDIDKDDFVRIANEERTSVRKLLSYARKGRIMILKNRRCKNPRVVAIGDGLRTKINANIGLSGNSSTYEQELEKALVTQEYGADILGDLSIAKHMDDFSDLLLAKVRIPVSTVPIYQLAVLHDSIEDANEDDFLNIIQTRAKKGYDPIEIHATINLSNISKLQQPGRLIRTVSRGGAIIARWMISQKKENPFFKHHDYILEMAKNLNFSIGYVPTLRHGCIADCANPDYQEEIMVIGKLVKKALTCGVQVRVPGPSHMPLDQIRNFIQWEKEVCSSVPLGALGPIVTDVSISYDHISHAIGAAMAAFVGANYITAITPSEHLGLPTAKEMLEGIISARIAAHAADISICAEKWIEWDNRIGEARSQLDWKSIIQSSMNPSRVKKMLARNKTVDIGCSMCGEYCPIRFFRSGIRCKRN